MEAMDFEQFKEFMLNSAAQHDARRSQIEESLTRLANTAQVLVDNQIHLQENADKTETKIQELTDVVRELGRYVMRHASDSDAHRPT